MIAVIGLGFVGLSTALGFADKTDFTVYGYETDKRKAEILKNKKIPFYEPYLEEKLNEHLNGRFILADSMKDAVKNAEAVFFCVGTPTSDEGKSDLSILKTAVEEALKHTASFKVFVIKSTVPPSSFGKDIKNFINERGHTVGETVGLTVNPEFLREGFAWNDFINPDRIVIGVSDDKSRDLLGKVYRSFDAPICFVSLNTAAFIKYLSNTLLSTLISFSNEMSMVADAIGDIDIKDAFKILHMDKRWSGSPANMTSYVYPGCGFGGYCLPKDTQAFYSKSKESGYTPEIIGNVIKTNSKIREFISDKVAKLSSADSKIGILGLAFKPGSDDVRDTPAKYIIDGLLNRNRKNIYAYDPMAAELFKSNYSYDITYCKTLAGLVENCDVLVLLTAWKEFIDNKSLFSGKTVIDARYVL